MNYTQDLQKVLELRGAILSGDDKRLKEQRDAGKMTARERVAAFADEGTFVELFALVNNAGEGTGVVTGFATINERPVYIFAQDFAVKGGAMGMGQAAKICKLLDLALKTGTPVVAMLDSVGVRIDEGAASMNAYSEIYNKMARMSGVCPMIGLILGPCIGGASLISQLCDVTIMVEKIASLLTFGPQVLAAMNEKEVNADAFGGASVSAKNGLAALTAANEAEAFAKAKAVLNLLPSNNFSEAEIVDTDDMNRILSELSAEDSAAVANAIADAGTAIELYKDYAPASKVFLARVGGRCAMIVAVNGKLDAASMKKIARAVRTADCFGLPILTLMNTEGVELSAVSEQADLMKAQTQMLFAYSEATAAKLTVVTGNAIGQAYAAMGGKGNADVTYAWPSAVISAIAPEAAVAVLYADEVKADTALSVDEARSKYAAKYVEDVAGAVAAASNGLVDDIIEPAVTRQKLISALEMLASKRDSNPLKKHGNLTM